jgi:threonine/homoserine/homoserine lactone efflux protein
MTITSVLLFALVYAVATASPGPGVAALVARVLSQGLAGIGAFIAGFVVGDLVWFAIAVGGLSVIAQHFAVAFVVIRYLGAAYLLWLAWRMWRAPAARLDVAAQGARERPWRLFGGSLALSLGNPKVIVFFVSVMPLTIEIEKLTLLDGLELALVMAGILAPMMLVYALVAERARRLFRSARALQILRRGTAGVMAGAALAVAAR